MQRETTRRAVLAGGLGAGVAGAYFSPVATYLQQFAPLSGTVWEPARFSRNSTVESPYGEAEVRYDADGVPNISADDEQALYFAAGYVQGTDRLFQMDLQRRLITGRAAEVAGSGLVDSDTFHQQMMFKEAAEATAEFVSESPAGPAATAYVDGVNAARENESLELGFRLLDYEPEEWTLADSMATEKLIAWGLTGNFRPLRKARVRDIFGTEMANSLYPDRFAETVPIIREHHDPPVFGEGLNINPGDMGSTTASAQSYAQTREGTGTAVGGELVDRLLDFEPARLKGSNSWVVGPELTGEGAIVSNDPHLNLQAPPIWYEMHLDGPDHRVRGVTFPGVPFVIIGENDHGAWGFTNVGADVIDFYSYETSDDGTRYQYAGEEREFDIETRELDVSGAANEEIEIKQSVHGPVIEESEQEVGVRWTGHAATETTLAIYELAQSEGATEAREAASKFDSPTQNMIYGDRDGNRWFHIVGRLPVRRTDGDVVSGNQVFDGSTGEGEWTGFEPFSRPEAWDVDGVDDLADGDPAFVPFSENPHVDNPEYLATANQLTVDDAFLAYYLGVGFAPRYRGERIYDLLDGRIESGDDIDLEFLQTVGRDTRDGRAVALVDTLLEAVREREDEFENAIETLESWSEGDAAYEMNPDSPGALLFDRWMGHYRDELFEEAFDEADLGSEYYPSDGAIEEISADANNPWFGPRRRGAVMRAALSETLSELDEEGYETYGDVSHSGQIPHLTQLGFLAYPTHPRGGSGDTVKNFSYRGPWGGSWEMQVDLRDGGEYLSMLPGGNSGRYFSTHYDDQIEQWAAGEYRSLSREIEGDLAVTFEGESQ